MADDTDSLPEQTGLAVVSVANVPYIAPPEELHVACCDLGLNLYEPVRPVPTKFWRKVYVTPSFAQWVGHDLSAVVASDLSQASPRSQLNSELEAFCIGRVLVMPLDFHCLEPSSSCVWQLKTPDLRLFGWFIKKDWIILHRGEDANRLHGIGFAAYASYIKSTVEFRNALSPALPGPIYGVRPGDVISNRVR